MGKSRYFLGLLVFAPSKEFFIRRIAVGMRYLAVGLRSSFVGQMGFWLENAEKPKLGTSPKNHVPLGKFVVRFTGDDYYL